MTIEEIEHSIGHVEEGIKVLEDKLRANYIVLSKLKADLIKAQHDAKHPHFTTTEHPDRPMATAD